MKHVSTINMSTLPVWEKLKDKRALYSFDLEITARCNLNCRHCYINLPAGDQEAKAKELSLSEIGDIAGQAVELGALWCLITGGEPLLRPDFIDIYLMLKRKGLLLSVFTNATLLKPEHIALFKKYPPRDIEVTTYGSQAEVFDNITRHPGSFTRFRKGLKELLTAGIPVRLKAMALRSNRGDLDKIAAFCRDYTKDYYRFDPLLHLRFDGDAERNEEIKSERLTPDDIVAIERADAERFGALQKSCHQLIDESFTHLTCDHLFHCGAGDNSCVIGYDGTFRLCSSLWAPGTTVNLHQTRLADAWEKWVPEVRDMRSGKTAFLNTCHRCALINLCWYCPAHAHLEVGTMDGEAPYFCQVAHARAKLIQECDVF